MKSKVFLAVTLFSLIFNAYAGMSEAQKAFDTQDYATALKEAQPLAEQGNAEAQNLMGQLYDTGRISIESQRWKEAARWYRRAADQNYAPALNTLGGRYTMGLGVPINVKMSVELVRKASDQNYAPAQFSLGLLLMKKDSKKSLELINKAADQNNTSAMRHLGLLYEQGYGVKIDYEKAKEWYQKAADLGDTNAQTDLQRIVRELAKNK